MSTDGLDDFFAKKDKKKKPKVKFTTDGLLEQQKDDVERKKKKTKSKIKKEINQSVSASTFMMENDEDWIEFEEEKEIDYTGLKIANLQISKETGEENQNDEDDEYDEEGEGENKVKEESGPWKAVIASQHIQQTPTLSPPEPLICESEEPEPENNHPKKYVPPVARRAAAVAAANPLSQTRTSRFRRKEAPDMANEMEFPSLGVTSTASYELSPDGSFEAVKIGGNRDIDVLSGTQKLELVNNRFRTN